jgi:uncharacterized membrane protein YhaH (DUF805 family)
MNWTQYLFSFEGRINRAKLWLAALIWFATIYSFMTLFTWIVMGILLATGQHSWSSETSPWFYLSVWPLLVIFVWLFLATLIKRLHDRARSGWWLAMLLVAPFLLNKFSDWLDYGPLAALVSVLDIGVSVWCFVELFCLRGTRGPNRFGSDPLAPVAAAAPAEMRPLWDQQSELEFVRRGAGPSPGEHVKRGHD